MTDKDKARAIVASLNFLLTREQVTHLTLGVDNGYVNLGIPYETLQELLKLAAEAPV